VPTLPLLTEGTVFLVQLVGPLDLFDSCYFEL